MVTVDPYSGLQFVELSHIWKADAPSYPGEPDVQMSRAVKHAQHGVLAWKIKTTMHTGTHMIAPIHIAQKGDDLSAIDPARFLGNGIILDLRSKGSYDQITEEDIKNAGTIKDHDIVVINTGWHNKYSDSLEYYGEAPGLTKGAAEYLLRKNPKFVAIDTPFLDCPLATSMSSHRGGPCMKRLVKAYEETTGRNALEDFPDWNPAHRVLAYAGVPVLLQAGGDIDEVTGKRATLAATPWKIFKGDACIVRFVAMFDPSGSIKIDSGK